MTDAIAGIKMLLQSNAPRMAMPRAVMIVVSVLAVALLAGLYCIWTPDKSRARWRPNIWAVRRLS